MVQCYREFFYCSNCHTAANKESPPMPRLGFDIETANIITLARGENLDDHGPLDITVAATHIDGGEELLWLSAGANGIPLPMITRNRTREKNRVGDQARHNIIGANPPLAHSRRMHRRPNARSIMDGHPAAAREIHWMDAAQTMSSLSRHGVATRCCHSRGTARRRLLTCTRRSPA